MEPREQLRSIVDSYVSDLEVRRPGKYAEETKAQIHRTLDAIGWDVTVPALIAFRARCKRQEPPLSNRTINKLTSSLSRVFRWAERHDMWERNPLGRLVHLPERECDRVKRRRVLTRQERDRFLDAVRAGDRYREVPQEPLWRAILETGLRWHEALSLRASDLHGLAIVVRADVAKSGKRRMIPIDRDLATLLRKWLPFRSPRGLAFKAGHSTGWRMFIRELKEAGISRVDEEGRSLDIHALRHDCATHMYRSGVALDSIAEVMGHTDSELTRRVYIHDDVEALRKEVRKAWR